MNKADMLIFLGGKIIQYKNENHKKAAYYLSAIMGGYQLDDLPTKLIRWAIDFCKDRKKDKDGNCIIWLEHTPGMNRGYYTKDAFEACEDMLKDAELGISNRLRYQINWEACNNK